MESTLERARSLFLQGIEQFEQNRLEEARAAFEAALALAPGRPSIQGNLGITLFRLDRRDEALPLLKAAVAADPDHAEAWACLALDAEARASWQEALDALDNLLRLQPQQAPLILRRGECLLRLNRTQQALAAFDAAVKLDRNFADAWSARGNLLRELGQLEEAARCFHEALACGGDAELNTYYLASVSGAGVIPAPPRRYVEALFDDYADSFQQHVVQHLRYRGHELLLQPVLESRRRFHRALDLGCGTGLCGVLIQPIADIIDGVDISQSMLEQTRKLGVYRHLVHADLPSYLATANEKADLVVAADVFIYVGELAPIFQAVRRLLQPDGCFAFTVELPTNGEDLQLLPSLRYAHSENYVRQLANTFGFQITRQFAAPIREDQGKPIQGMVFHLR